MNAVDFARTGMSGVFEEEKAGKRMKLKVPETWETQVSMKGNKAQTWEDLIDHRKLPYMAMLRNIRNLIKAGISETHHNLILKKICDEGAVRSSKQSSFRFFSAYDALKELDEQLEKNEELPVAEETTRRPSKARGGARGGSRGRGGARGGSRGRGGRGSGRGNVAPKISTKQNLPFTQELIARYRKSLDDAVRIATTFNTKQIPGRTMVYVDLGGEEASLPKSARGLGKSVRSPDELAYLLALQASVACEDCHIVGYGSQGKVIQLTYDPKNTILGAMSGLGDIKRNLDSRGPSVLPDLSHHIHNQRDIDNLLVFSLNPLNDKKVTDFILRYQRFVNPNLLFVDVSLCGGAASPDESNLAPNYVKISGFSDQILRFVGERGDAAQVLQVENVDLKFDIRKEEKMEQATSSANQSPILEYIPPSCPLKVFISSTFKDFHSERNILTQFIFPEIRSRSSQLGIDVQEIDMRWGITEEESKRQDNAVERCLKEVEESFIFVGMLGERYGTIPNLDSSSYHGLAKDMISQYPGASITELECRLGIQKPRGRVFFFLRDDAFLENIDEEVKESFVSAEVSAKSRLKQLKESVIIPSGHEVIDGYPCEWAGMSGKGKPVLQGLEDFAVKVISCIWQCLINEFEGLSEDQGENSHVDFGLKESENVVGRNKEMAEMWTMMDKLGMVTVTGKMGIGKTAFLAHVAQKFKIAHPNSIVIQHFTGIVPGSAERRNFLQNLYSQLCEALQVQNNSLSCADLIKELHSLIKCSTESGKRLLIVVDAVEALQNPEEFCNLNWMPVKVPEICKVVVSCLDSKVELCDLIRKQTKVVQGFLTLKGMDISSRKEMVRLILEKNGKKLEESAFNNQLHMLVSKRDACLPRYISLACDQVKMYGNFEELSEMIQQLPTSKEQLVKQMLIELEEDFGSNFVGLCLQVLALYEKGLTSNELQFILCQAESLGITSSGKLDVKKLLKIQNEHDFIVTLTEVGSHQIPFAQFIPFLSRLQAILSFRETGPQRDHFVLNDALLRKVVDQRYLKSKQLQRKVFYHGGKRQWALTKVFHLLLFCHSLSAISRGSSGDFDCSMSWKLSDDNEVQITGFQSDFCSKAKESFVKLLFYLQASEAWNILLTLVTSLKFIYSMIQLHLSPILLDEYNRLMIDGSVEPFLIQPFQRFVSKNHLTFTKNPGAFWQQALNEQSCIKDQANTFLNTDHIQLPADCSSLAILIQATSTSDIVQAEIPPSNDGIEIRALTFSPNGKLLACGTSTGIVTVVDVLNSTTYATLIGHSNAVTFLLFLRSDRLASSSIDSTISLWDIRNKYRIKVLNQHRDVFVKQLQANPIRAESFVSVALDSKIYFWNSKSGEEISKISARSPINCVTYHPHGLKVSTGHWDGTVRIFEVMTGQQKAVLRGHAHAVKFLSFTESGHQIFSVDLTGAAIFWQAEINLPIRQFVPHDGNFLTSFATGDKFFITGDQSGQIKVWPGSFCVPDLSIELKEASCVAMTQSSESLFITVGFHSGAVEEYKICPKSFTVIDTKVSRSPHTKRVTSITYFSVLGKDPRVVSQEEMHILSTSEDGSFKIHSSSDLLCEYTYCGQTGILCGCVISPISSKDISDLDEDVPLGDHIVILTGHHDCSAKAHVLFGYSGFPEAVNQDQREVTFRSHTAPVTAISYSRDNSTILTSGRDGCTYLWDVPDILKSLYQSVPNTNTLAPTAYQHVHNDWTNGSAWSDDWKGLVTCSNDNSVRFSSFEELKTTLIDDVRGAHSSTANAVVAKDKLFFSCSQDGSVGIWTKSKNKMAQLNSLELNPSQSFVDLDVVQNKRTIPNREEVKDMSDVVDTCIVAVISEASLGLWQPLKVSSSFSFGNGSNVSSIAVSQKTPEAPYGALACALMDGSIKVMQPPVTIRDKFYSEHNTSVVAMKSVLFHDTELIISGSEDGCIQGHNQHEGNMEKLFEVFISESDPVKMKFMDICQVSDSVVAICYVSTKAGIGSNSTTGVLTLKKSESGKVEVVPLAKQSLKRDTLLCKSYKTDQELILVSANTTSSDESFLNFEAIPLSSIQQQSEKKGKALQKQPKISLRHVVSLQDWPVDLEWHVNTVTVIFCNAQPEIFSVPLKTEKTLGTGAVSDFREKLIFLEDHDKMWSEHLLVAATDIVAYDIFQHSVLIASSDKSVQFWRRGKMIGRIAVDAKVTCLALSKASHITTLDQNLVFASLGTQSGELLTLKWIWSD